MNTKDIPNSDRPSQSADQSSTKELPAQIAVEEACDISIHDGDFKKRQVCQHRVVQSVDMSFLQLC